jgi:choline dehydrogenase-like flavoprotein
MAGRSQRWISRGAEQLEVLLQESQRDGAAFDCDVLVVGSGYGGAVAAARLAGCTVEDDGGPAGQPAARRPARIWLVERGAEQLPGGFPSRFSELAGHVRIGLQDGQPPRGRDEGLFDLRVGSDVCVLLGNGLGGGSLINAGVMEQPQPEVFGGGHWPTAITPEAMAGAYERAHEMLAPQRVHPPERETRKLKLLDDLAQAQGLGKAERCQVTVNFEPSAVKSAAGVDLHRCTLCGDCLTGCNQGAKGSLDTNYLAHAWQRGVQIFCGVAVHDIEPGGAEAAGGAPWRVRWHYTDRQLRRTQPHAGVVRARHLVLAAGSLGSTEILLRSRAALGLPEGRLGRGFSINGDTLVAGVGHERRVGIAADPESDPADAEARRVGPTITGLVRVPQGEQVAAPFVVEEFGVPAALRQVLGEVTTSRALFGVDAVDPGLPLAADPFVVHDDAIERTSLFGVMGDDGARGELTLPPVAGGTQRAVEGGVRITWASDGRPGMLFGAANEWLRTATSASGGTVLAGSELLAGSAPMPAVHPLGGCAMAKDGARGVVDALGRVFRGPGTDVHRTLAVLDGSIVPRSLGINPALTIAALAERALPELKDSWGFEDAAAAPQPLPSGRAPARRRELSPSEASWVVRERLQGPCNLGGQPLWAQLELEFDPVPGFRKALQLTHRVVRVRSAQLTLRAVAPGADEFSIDDETPPERAWKAQLAGTVELFRPEQWPDGKDGIAASAQVAQLTYRLAVTGTSEDMPAGWHVGARLLGVKTVHSLPGSLDQPVPSPWRQLSEMAVSLDGQPLGCWALDLADLAQRREPLLSLLALTTMPDALADLGSVALYGVRRLLPRLLSLDALSPVPTEPAQLTERRPGAYKVGGPLPTFVRDESSPHGWQLARYRGDGGEGTPVVLIHGLGASGANFTHPVIEGNLARVLHEAGRDVWVLELRSSIANEPWRHTAQAATASVEQVAQWDIPPAIERVCEISGQAQVDVFAHCMGAVMFTLAALGDPGIRHGRIRAAVLSQVGPILRLSAFNQLRGFIGSYLQEFLQVREFDATPDVRVDEAGQPQTVTREGAALLLDALLATFPYPDDDDEAGVAAKPPLQGTAFTNIRHRADAIFGQLFELKNVAPEVLARLAALFGWVKVPMLAQAIHFARQEMLTDARGRNAFLSGERLRERFDFPLLMLHGQRNRVFDWRGSLRSLRLLRRVRGFADAPSSEAQGASVHCAPGERAQLAVFKDYGHLDCIVGRNAARDVFSLASRFFEEVPQLRPDPGAPEARREPEAPWLGPMLGDIRILPATAGRASRRLEVYVLVHPSLRRRQTQGFAIVPVRRTAAGPEPDLGNAACFPWPGKHALVPDPGREGTPENADVRAAAVHLVFDEARLESVGDTFALLTLHKDLGLDDPATDWTRVDWMEDAWSLSGQLGVTAKNNELGDAVKKWVQAANERGELEDCLFSLSRKVRLAADPGEAVTRTPALSFALASCQYPPGLLDRGPAQASLRRLLADAAATDGPQFLLLAGDQVYADATAGVFEAGATAVSGPKHLAARFDRTYELNWALPAFRRLVSRLPVFPMLDDHEVRDNWQGQEAQASREELQEQQEALRAFERFQQVLVSDRVRLAPATGSFSYRIQPAGVPLFVLDTRTRRTPRTSANIETASILPHEDLDALIEALRAAPADVVKLVLTPVPLLPPERLVRDAPAERLRSDTWSGFPASAGTLLAAIRDHDIRRVVLLAGDSHLSSVTSFEFADRQGHRVVAIVSSGTYAPWPFANQRPDDFVLQGPVTLGASAGPSVAGRMALHALSAADGYAVVQLRSVPESSGVELLVSLRSGEGATIDSRLRLD